MRKNQRRTDRARKNGDNAMNAPKLSMSNPAGRLFGQYVTQVQFPHVGRNGDEITVALSITESPVNLLYTLRRRRQLTPSVVMVAGMESKGAATLVRDCLRVALMQWHELSIWYRLPETELPEYQNRVSCVQRECADRKILFEFQSISSRDLLTTDTDTKRKARRFWNWRRGQ